MSYEKIEAQFLDYLEGRLTAEERAHVEDMLKKHSDLANSFEKYQEILRTEKSIAKETFQPSEELRKNIMSNIAEKSASAPSIVSSIPSRLQKFSQRRPLFAGASTFATLALILVVSLNTIDSIQMQLRNEDADTLETASNGSTITLYAPVQAVPAGTSLSNLKFRAVRWPRNSAPEDAIRDPTHLSRLYARTALTPGIPLTLSQTATVAPFAGTPLQLAPENRAVTIEVEETSGIEGHAQPGKQVDVVLTHSQGGKLESSIIVENARVLSYGGDTTIGKDSGRNAHKINRTITLDVSTSDALKISTAQQMGRISLFMRAPADDKAANTTVLDANELSSKRTDDSATKPQGCTKGKVRIGERTFLINCDGSMKQAESRELRTFIAKNPIPAGTKLTENLFYSEFVPEKKANAQAIHSLEKLEGRYNKVALRAGDVLLESYTSETP